MIGKIRGQLVEVDGYLGLIETQSGVFYHVYLPQKLLAQTLPIQLEVYTYLQVRADALVLFGFETKTDYQLFLMLLSVPSVGPKTAFTVVSAVTVSELTKAVTDNDTEYLTRIPGLGKKTALKIMLELSTKLKTEFKFEHIYVSEDDKTVIDALVSLGFKSPEAKDILTRIPKDLSLEQKIQAGIRLGTHS